MIVINRDSDDFQHGHEETGRNLIFVTTENKIETKEISKGFYFIKIIKANEVLNFKLVVE